MLTGLLEGRSGKGKISEVSRAPCGVAPVAVCKRDTFFFGRGAKGRIRVYQPSTNIDACIVSVRAELMSFLVCTQATLEAMSMSMHAAP